MDSQEVFDVVNICVREAAMIDMDDDELTPECDLMDEGFVDSLGLVSIIIQVETNYNIKFTDGDIAQPRLATIKGLAEMISEKLGL